MQRGRKALERSGQQIEAADGDYSQQNALRQRKCWLPTLIMQNLEALVEYVNKKIRIA
jgi:hypothetical protein